MKRQEALRHFYEKYVNAAIQTQLLNLETFYQAEKDSLAEVFIESFRQFCLLIREQQQVGLKKEVSFLTYSLLRTNLLLGGDIYLTEAFNADWYLDFKPYQANYDASWAFRFLTSARQELQDKAKLYMGKIYSADVTKIYLAEADKFHQYIISLARYALPRIRGLPEFQAINKVDPLEIRVGEYRHSCEIVYIENSREKEASEIKTWLEKKLAGAYVFQVLKNLELAAGDYQKNNFSYTNFTGSNLAESNFQKAILIETKFHQSCLVKTNYSNAFIHGADFSRANLERANFFRAQGFQGLSHPDKWENPGYLPVNFGGANLTKANFTFADLRGAVFCGANLVEANFKGANLHGAVFDIKQQNYLALTKEQADVAKWQAGNQEW